MFQKGRSGNPGGRSKREPIITQRIISILTANECAKLHKLAEAIVEQALSGDLGAMNSVMDRVEGKAPQPVTGDEDNPVVIEHGRAREFIARRILEVATAAAASEDSRPADTGSVH